MTFLTSFIEIYDFKFLRIHGNISDMKFMYKAKYFDYKFINQKGSKYSNSKWSKMIE